MSAWSEQPCAANVGYAGMKNRMEAIADDFVTSAGSLAHQGFALNDFGIRLAHQGKSKVQSLKSKVEIRLISAMTERGCPSRSKQ